MDKCLRNGEEKVGHTDMNFKIPFRKERTKEVGWCKDSLIARKSVAWEAIVEGKPDKGEILIGHNRQNGEESRIKGYFSYSPF